jgi:hypothetical protein
MARGDTPHLDGEPDGGPARQREILAQFEAAIAGMHTRNIQIGLRQLLAGTVPPPHAPAPVAELVRAVKTASARRQMQQLVGDAQLERRVQIDAGTAARMVRPYRWLLDRAGDGGLRLTEAGHLPPAEVTAAVHELKVPAPGGWPRENQVPRVRQLRESAQAMGLLRRERGQLLVTTRGAELRFHPGALWWHLAERMPLRSATACEVQPGVILLVCVAARCTDTLGGTIARMLNAIGWMNGDGGPLTGADAARATAFTHATLRWLGALPFETPPDETEHAPWPTPEGVAFARAALRSWP